MTGDGSDDETDEHRATTDHRTPNDEAPAGETDRGAANEKTPAGETNREASDEKTPAEEPRRAATDGGRTADDVVTGGDSALGVETDGDVGIVGRVALRFPTLVLARRNLSRARVRTALAVAAVVIGVVAIGGVGLGGDAFTRSQTAAFSGFGGTADVFPVDSVSFSDDQLARIEQVAGGARVIPVSAGRAVAESRTESQPIQFTRIGRPGVFYADETAAGEIPDNWGTREEVIVGSAVAEDLAVSPGDRLTLQTPGGETERVVVTAVLSPQGFFDPFQADRRVFLTPQEDQEYQQVIVQATDDSDPISQIVTDLRDTFNARDRTISVVQNQETFGTIQTVLNAASAFVTAVGGVSLLVAVVTIANTMLMAVIERRGEIGVLRAVGYPKLAVVRILLAESAMIGAIGVAVGVPLAVGMGVVANWSLLGEPFAFTLVGAAYVVAGAVAGVVASVLAGLYPAWQAANERPVEAIE